MSELGDNLVMALPVAQKEEIENKATPDNVMESVGDEKVDHKQEVDGAGDISEQEGASVITGEWEGVSEHEQRIMDYEQQNDPHEQPKCELDNNRGVEQAAGDEVISAQAVGDAKAVHTGTSTGVHNVGPSEATGSVKDEYSHYIVAELEALALKEEKEFKQEDVKRERLQAEIAELQVVLQYESQALYEDAERRRHEAEAASALAKKNYAATEEAMKSVQLQESYLRDLVAKMKPRKGNNSIWSNFVRNISPGNDKAKLEKAAAAEKAANALTVRRRELSLPTPDVPLVISGKERWGQVQELLLCHGKGTDCVRTCPLFVRMLSEDIRPCLESYRMDTDYLVDQLWTNTLQIQPAPLQEQREDVCALSSIRLLCSHRFRATGDRARPEHKDWSPLGSPCYSRVTAVGDLIAYLRYIGMGINKSSAGVIFQDIVSKLLHISATRLGIPTANNHKVGT